MTSHESPQVLAPPWPVVPENARPYFQVIWNPFVPKQLREVAILLHDRVVLAGRDHPAHARQLPDPLAVHVRDVRRRAIEVAVVVPVAVREAVDVVDAGE